MAETEVRVENPAMVLHMRPPLEMDEERFFEFCRQNKGWRIERSAGGDLEIVPPTGGETSNRKANLTMQVGIWTRQDGTGVSFDSNGGFVLPSGAIRSPDASWVRRERLANLTADQKRRFLPLCPDFVVELRSPSDPLPPIEAKMREYLENGARLGWLIDPVERKVHIYKPGDPVEALESPGRLSGDPILSGFTLDLRPIWEPGF